MVYYTLILNEKRATAHGLYPIVVRITHGKNNTTLTTGIRINKEHWDKISQRINSKHSNFQLLNKSLGEYYLKVQKAILKLQEEDKFSFESLKQFLSDRPVSTKEATPVTFLEFSSKLIQDMIELNKSGNALVYQTAAKRLTGYAGTSLFFQDIDYNLLDGFRKHLLLSGVKQNTVSNYFRTIKAIYNKAIKAKLVDRSSYPFLDIPIKQERTPKRAIGLEEIEAILKLDLKPNTPLWHSRNYFMLSFCLMGISFTDLAYLKLTNIIKGRLMFNRRKTHKKYDIKLTPQAQSIFNYYNKGNCAYLLCILSPNVTEDSLEAKKTIHQWIKTANKYLKRLGEDIGLKSPLTTYVARHSWATTAKKMGYSNELIAEAMGHEYGNRITGIYLDSFESGVVDDMNNKISEKLFSNRIFL
ncbi:site-specific integrase [Daejeonella sp. JGW-45]|uniref:site-specific integrase n=1 Tax=Daejeonella sp. JGW-45 TaxID=3034148 RepID=UPI0023EB4A29|nr:site-specific integrase [Daejeonella sp. JGW-45]